MNYAELIRDIPDFPKPGIVFKDITPLLANAEALKAIIEDMSKPFLNQEVDMVVGMESRGFIFGPAIATQLGAGFAPVRKPGKLPYKTNSQSYDLEYGKDTLEIHHDAAHSRSRVLIVDDLIATGGTAGATAKLIEGLGAKVIGFCFAIELDFLKGRDRLGDYPIHSILHY